MASRPGLKKGSGSPEQVPLPCWAAFMMDNGCWETGVYDTGRFRDALEKKGTIKPCIPGRRSCERPVKYNRQKYKRRNRIESMLGWLKDWRRVVPRRYDKFPHIFFSAIRSVATVMFWI